MPVSSVSTHTSVYLVTTHTPVSLVTTYAPVSMVTIHTPVSLVTTIQTAVYASGGDQGYVEHMESM